MNDEKWRDGVDRDLRRLESGRKERRSLLAQTVFLGTLSVLFLAPMIGLAYFGHWLDHRGTGYPPYWTVKLILLGLAIGVFNVYQFIKKHW